MAKKKPATLTTRGGSVVFTGRGTDVKSEDNPVELPSTQSSGSIIRHPEFFFDNTLIAIRIENTLFNVHKYQLIKSEVFSDMFKMPKPEDNEPEEGSSPEHPIVIDGVAASDFTALLRVLYASHFSSNQPAPEAPLIIPAFRLANMFDFSELHAYLLPLAEKSLGDVDKIVLAREFDIKEWLAPAHIRLCKRDERLSTEEARKLEVDSVLMISHMREQYQGRGGATLLSDHILFLSITSFLDPPSTMAKKKPTTLNSQVGSTMFIERASEVKSDDEESSTESSEPVERRPEFFFDNTLVAIQVGRTLFNVRKYQLSKSEVFSDRFKKPKPEDNEPEEGSLPEHPIKLRGVSASDFAALLRVLYALLYASHFSSNQPAPETPLIIPAIRLANMFKSAELRAYLLPLAEKTWSM
ncbi:hypothetical protein FRC11_004556 [Ceratobasidium sp. 423]|nr:hypothetical protein FRC11_004556 [Ceratobasidium sp. 423]